MRISDWSSDVCSSDLASGPAHHPRACRYARPASAGRRPSRMTAALRRRSRCTLQRRACGEVERIEDARDGAHRRIVLVQDRKSVVWGKSVSVRDDPGGRLILKKKHKEIKK